jgi:hypothetical protein
MQISQDELAEIKTATLAGGGLVATSIRNLYFLIW